MPTRSLRELMLLRSEWFEQRAVAAAVRDGYAFVTPAMARLFAYVGPAPITPSEVARRLGVSRQAIHQTVAEACRRGMIELVDDPADRRVRRLRFTAAGKELARKARTALREIDRELERRIGPEDVAALRRILARPW